MPIALRASQDQGMSVGAWHEKDDARLVRTLMDISKGRFLVPYSMPVDERLLARFIAKMGAEAYVAEALGGGLSVDQLIGAQELKNIRRFVRQGDMPRSWPLNRRRIYQEDKVFSEGDYVYQILHEYSLLITDENEIYAIICIFGEEFVINLGGPSIDGYRRWLSANGNRSPLYMT